MDFIIERNDEYALIEPKLTELGEEQCPSLEKIIRDLYRQGYTSMILDFTNVNNFDGFITSLLRKATKICTNEAGLFIVITDNEALTAKLDATKIVDLMVIRTKQEAADAVNLNDLENDFKGEDDDEYDYGDFNESSESDF